MKLARDYRREAHEKTRSQAGILAVICLIILAVTAIINFSVRETQVVEGQEIEIYKQPLSFLGLFVLGHIEVSFVQISKKVNLEEKVSVKDLLHGFKDYIRVLAGHFLVGLYTSLWTLLFIVPGLVKTYSYAMTYYILNERDDVKANEAITMSRRMMKGNKWRLFCLDLSYIGWMILCALTLGILSLWVNPRIKQARYIFFKEIYEENGYAVKSEEQLAL